MKKTSQHYFIKYGSMFFYAAGLMFWLHVFRNSPIGIFAICLAVAWAVLKDGDELDELKKKKSGFCPKHLKALKEAYKKEAKK